MITYEVELNGVVVATAGTPAMSVLSAMLTAVGKLGPESKGTRHDPDAASIELRVGGMTSPVSGHHEEHVDWIARPLAVGDEVVVRVRDSARADEPKERRAANVDEFTEREMFRHARETYLRLRDKYEKSSP
jgi:hypothetical protein